MLNVKFTKTDTAAYMSHLDLMRAINRTMKRAGFEPEFSKGFNPHAILKLSNPIPLGLKSEAEYFMVYLDVKKEEFLTKCNQNAPKGIVFLKAWTTNLNPNFARDITMSCYKLADSLDLEKQKRDLINSEIAKPIKLTSGLDGFIMDLNNKYAVSLTKASLIKTAAFIENPEVISIEERLNSLEKESIKN